MARFYGSIQGNRGEATRMGTASSGISAHVRGWDVGVKVDGGPVNDGCDTFDVYATGGSNNPNGKRIATVSIDQYGMVRVDYPEVLVRDERL